MEKVSKNKSFHSTSVDSSFEEEISELCPVETEPSKKYFEDYNLEEIYDFIDEIDKSELTDMNSIFKKEKEIQLLPEKNTNNECKEILDIFKSAPFKILKVPKKVSLIGKVFIYDNDNINNMNNVYNNKKSNK